MVNSFINAVMLRFIRRSSSDAAINFRVSYTSVMEEDLFSGTRNAIFHFSASCTKYFSQQKGNQSLTAVYKKKTSALKEKNNFATEEL